MDPDQLSNVNEANGAPPTIALIISGVVVLSLVVFFVVTMWKIYAKAGEPGWAALVPIYSQIVRMKISGSPLWWVVFILLPPIYIIFAIIATVGLAERFGKGGWYAVGLIVLPMIFYPMLAFGNAIYIGPKTA
jgi:hypothetical protein